MKGKQDIDHLRKYPVGWVHSTSKLAMLTSSCHFRPVSHPAREAKETGMRKEAPRRLEATRLSVDHTFTMRRV